MKKTKALLLALILAFSAAAMSACTGSKTDGANAITVGGAATKSYDLTLDAAGTASQLLEVAVTYKSDVADADKGYDVTFTKGGTAVTSGISYALATTTLTVTEAGIFKALFTMKADSTKTAEVTLNVSPTPVTGTNNILVDGQSAQSYEAELDEGSAVKQVLVTVSYKSDVAEANKGYTVAVTKGGAATTDATVASDGTITATVLGEYVIEFTMKADTTKKATVTLEVIVPRGIANNPALEPVAKFFAENADLSMFTAASVAEFDVLSAEYDGLKASATAPEARTFVQKVKDTLEIDTGISKTLTQARNYVGFYVYKSTLEGVTVNLSYKSQEGTDMSENVNRAPSGEDIYFGTTAGEVVVITADATYDIFETSAEHTVTYGSTTAYRTMYGIAVPAVPSSRLYTHAVGEAAVYIGSETVGDLFSNGISGVPFSAFLTGTRHGGEYGGAAQNENFFFEFDFVELADDAATGGGQLARLTVATSTATNNAWNGAEHLLMKNTAGRNGFDTSLGDPRWAPDGVKFHDVKYSMGARIRIERVVIDAATYNVELRYYIKPLSDLSGEWVLFGHPLMSFPSAATADRERATNAVGALSIFSNRLNGALYNFRAGSEILGGDLTEIPGSGNLA